MTMGDRIHTLRKDKGLTLEDIGRAAGVAKSTVRKCSGRSGHYFRISLERGNGQRSIL